MPSAIEYIPPTDNRRNDFNTAVEKERRKRKERYETALRYYEGYPDDPIPVDPDDPEYDPTIDMSNINLTKMTADRTVSFLFPEMPDFQTDPDSIEDTEEEKWLKETFFPENGELEALSVWALRGFLAGHAFVWLKAAKPVPKMVVLHPLSVTVFWSADDVNDILWYEMRYIAQGRAFIRDFVKQEDGSWKIYEYEGLANARTREDVIIDQITHKGNSDASINLDNLYFGDGFKAKTKRGSRHPHTIPPIIEVAHLPHPDDHYGLGEFTQKDLQDIINRIAALRNRIVRENSDPVDVVDADIDEVQDEGSIIAIPKGSKVTRLSMNSDLPAINSTLNDLIEKYLAVARVVLLKGEAKDLQRVTNAAVRTLFLDALAKNSLLRSAYGNALAKVCKLALDMAYANGDITANPVDLRVVVKFGSPLPTDLTEVANINALALNGGYMSKHSAAVALNLDPAFENKKMEGEREEDMKHQEEQMSMMQKFAPDPNNTESGKSQDPKPSINE